MCTRHEIVGIIREVGSNVKRFKVGDHVGVGTYVNSCRECEYCCDGLEVHCLKGAICTFDSLDVDGTITKGGYSSYVVVHERCIFCTTALCCHPFLISETSSGCHLCTGTASEYPRITH